jgi:hypothetical protein
VEGGRRREEEGGGRREEEEGGRSKHLHISLVLFEQGSSLTPCNGSVVLGSGFLLLSHFSNQQLVFELTLEPTNSG